MARGLGLLIKGVDGINKSDCQPLLGPGSHPSLPDGRFPQSECAESVACLASIGGGGFELCREGSICVHFDADLGLMLGRCVRPHSKAPSVIGGTEQELNDGVDGMVPAWSGVGSWGPGLRCIPLPSTEQWQ